MAFYNPFPQYNTGLNQAQQWSQGQQAALPPQSPPYGTPPIPTYSGRPIMDSLRNMFGNIRQNRQFRQLARQGINPFTGQAGTSIQSQPDTGMSAQSMPRTAAPAQQQQQGMGFQPQNMGFNPYQQLGMMYGMGGIGGMLGGQGGYGGYGQQGMNPMMMMNNPGRMYGGYGQQGMGGYGGQMNMMSMLPYLQAMSAPMGNYMGQMMPYGTRNQEQRQRLSELVQSGNLFGNRGTSGRGSRVPRGAY